MPEGKENMIHMEFLEKDLAKQVLQHNPLENNEEE